MIDPTMVAGPRDACRGVERQKGSEKKWTKVVQVSKKSDPNGGSPHKLMEIQTTDAGKPIRFHAGNSQPVGEACAPPLQFWGISYMAIAINNTISTLTLTAPLG